MGVTERRMACKEFAAALHDDNINMIMAAFQLTVRPILLSESLVKKMAVRRIQINPPGNYYLRPGSQLFQLPESADANNEHTQSRPGRSAKHNSNHKMSLPACQIKAAGDA